jgi:hypothetical protein
MRMFGNFLDVDILVRHKLYKRDCREVRNIARDFTTPLLSPSYLHSRETNEQYAAHQRYILLRRLQRGVDELVCEYFNHLFLHLITQQHSENSI